MSKRRKNMTVYVLIFRDLKVKLSNIIQFNGHFYLNFFNRFIPVHSYDSLFSYLASGTEIRYIFNVSSCVDPDNPPQYKDIPTFGGKINHFDASPNSGDKPGQSSFNDAQFIHGKTYSTVL